MNRLPILALAVALGGCALAPRFEVARPERFVRRYEQLVVHSDFELPEQHRLLAELTGLRRRLATDLALPSSDEPIHVYLFESPERFGDFLTLEYPAFPHRRALFVESDTELTVYAHWGDRVAEDLRHEVAHGYLHAVVGLPLWLDEGLAEYYETPRGQWGLNPAHLRRLLDDHQAGAWQPDLRRLESLRSIRDMTQLDYAEAWAWTHWLLRTEPARAELFRAYLNRLRQEGPPPPPLSAKLAGATPTPEALLLAHLKQLAAQPTPLATDW